jgi:hypothetical protein
MLFEHEFVDHWKIAGRGLEVMLPKDGTPFFQNFHNHSFFKIVIIIRFSSFDNISRRHTS